MAKAGVIEPSSSPWAVPVVLVHKKNGHLHFCVDYRRLNAVMKVDSYPLPRIDDPLVRLAGSQWFSSLDLRSGYWQVALADDAKEKTAFTMGGGLWHFRLKLHPKKCSLLQRKVAFLGHVVTAEGVATNPAKVEAVEQWPTPANLEQLRSFLGLASYDRRFVCDFANQEAPLHWLTEKGAEFILDTNASNFGIGAVLSQEQEGQERLLAYFSRGLSKPERNYCVTRQELLAVVAGLKHFKPYLYGTPFTLRTDHASLIWLMCFKEPEGQMARWLTAMQKYQFQIVHRDGKKHNNADALPRRPCSEQACRYCERLEDRHKLQARCAIMQRIPGETVA
ncbi:hypothetical protein SRHO_G00096530 [Serrasalmus rhombeus]